MSREEEVFTATVADNLAEVQRAKFHYRGTVTAYDPTTSPATVTLSLEGGTVEVQAAHLISYGGYNNVTLKQNVPTPGDEVHVELVGNTLTVIDKLA